MKRWLTISVLLFFNASMSSAAEPAELLGLKAPVSVVRFDRCADGGSLKGVLRDSTGSEYHIFRKVLYNQREGPLPWYVGEDINSGKAELLSADDQRIEAVIAVLVEWVDSQTTPEEQQYLKTLPHVEVTIETLREKSRDEITRDTAIWTIVKYFK
jgi:hypothetical protein